MVLSAVAAAAAPRLVAHWPLDGDALDVAGGGLHGQAQNIAYVDGVIGQAASFDGVASIVTLADATGLPPEEIASLRQGSISLWFRFENAGDAGQVLPIFYYGEADATQPHNSLILEIGHGRRQANRRLYFTIVNQRFCFDSGISLFEDTWYHVAAVVGPDGNTGFLNGVEMVSRNYNLGSDASAHVFFADVPARGLLALGYGRYGLEEPFFRFRGAVDDVRIYDAPLDAAQVATLYAMGRP